MNEEEIETMKQSLRERQEATIAERRQKWEEMAWEECFYWACQSAQWDDVPYKHKVQIFAHHPIIASNIWHSNLLRTQNPQGTRTNYVMLDEPQMDQE